MSGSESLTAEDLRNRLYHSLREKGLVDSLKSQLRNRLVTELTQTGVTQAHVVQQPRSDSDGSLLHRAADSLVADHLQRSHYEYTFSVFLPECGTAEDKIFSVRDLLQLLNISPHSRLYQKLAAQHGNQNKGFLWQLLCEIAALHGRSSQTAAVQTDAVKLPPQSSLEEEFRKVDDHYAELSESCRGGVLAEERILTYQRKLDERAKSEVKLEVARIRDTEMSRMRLEERERLKHELETTRRELERTFQAKSDALVQRERHAIERLQKQQEIQERETYAQRQSLLEEIDAIRQREALLRRQEEVNNREKQLWEEKMKTSEELVKRREIIVRNAEAEYEQKLRNEIAKFKLEEQSRYQERTNNLDFREARVKADETRLRDELQTIQQVKDELREKRVAVNELEAELVRARHDLISYQKQTELLSEKLREMVDYQILKEENAVLRNELDGLKMRMAEQCRDTMVERQKQEGLLREMNERASKPTPETYFLQNEIDKLKNALHQDRVLYEHQKQQAERRLQEEMGKNQDLVRKFEEQTLQQKEMNTELQDMHQQLNTTKQALTNEVYRKPRQSALSSSDSLNDESSEADHVRITGLDPSLIRNAAEPELLFSASHGRFDHRGKTGTLGLLTTSLSDDYSYSQDLMQDTRKRLRNLEKEAENLDENYRNFQFRMTSVNAALDSHPVQTPPKHRVSFRDRPESSYPQVEYHTPVRQPGSTPAHRSGSSGRPSSSTPARQDRSDLTRDVYSLGRPEPEHERDNPLMNASVSTIRSSSPTEDLPSNPTGDMIKSRPLSLADLEARPGSPPVMVLKGSGSDSPLSQSRRSDMYQPHQEALRSDSPLEDIVNEADDNEGGVLLDDAWKKAAPASGDPDRAVLPDDRVAEEEEVDTDHEREEREYEERRRQREEERRKKEEEAWEREQLALQELQQQEVEAAKGGTAEDVKDDKEDDEEKEDEEDPDANIDPTMKKYMRMIEEQKQKEKQLAQNVIDTWTKGKEERPRTPSERSISTGADEKSSIEEDVVSEDFW